MIQIYIFIQFDCGSVIEVVLVAAEQAEGVVELLVVLVLVIFNRLLILSLWIASIVFVCRGSSGTGATR